MLDVKVVNYHDGKNVPSFTFCQNVGVQTEYKMALDDCVYNHKLHVWNCRFGIYKLVEKKHPVRCQEFCICFTSKSELDRFMDSFRVGQIRSVYAEPAL